MLEFCSVLILNLNFMKKPVVILLHLGYWMMYTLLLLLLMLFLMFPAISNGTMKFPVFNAFQFLFSFALFPGLISFYLFYTHVFKRFLSKRNILGVFVSGIAISIGSGIVGAIMMTILASLKLHVGLFNDGWSSAISLTIVMSLNTLANGIIGLVMKGFITSYGDIQLKEELNKKNYEMELELIKSQINPHFLFNTINNIDVLIEKDAAKASAYLNKLSDIMRFMLYEAKTEQIELTKELTYIEKYIDLQRIRTTNSEYINYTVNGDAKSFTIAPMLFIPFIENAFKHSENKKIEHAIRIQIDVKKDKIIFECENHYSKESQTKPDTSGLGNELIQKRLELLYPKKHLIEITNQNNIYKVKLTLS
jgi:two-component system LytT family sensor kinase